MEIHLIARDKTTFRTNDYRRLDDLMNSFRLPTSIFHEYLSGKVCIDKLCLRNTKDKKTGGEKWRDLIERNEYKKRFDNFFDGSR